jgi:hypothetical protein
MVDQGGDKDRGSRGREDGGDRKKDAGLERRRFQVRFMATCLIF